MGWVARVQFLVKVRFFLCHSIQTGSGSDPASCSVDTRAISLGVKWLACGTDRSLPFTAEVKNGEAIPTLPHASS
jgi:hypothetical protein